jgi:hypothetical protein
MPKVYAEKPFRFVRQLVTDVFVIAWTGAWIWLGHQVFELIMKLATPGRKIEDAGNGLADNLADAQSKADSIPLVGDKLGIPFGKAAEAARSLADAGQSQQDVVHDLALILGWAIGGIPILLVLALWLPLRVRWVRAASAASRLRRRQGGVELLALRALTNAPMRRLATLPDDTAEKWRAGDRGTMDSLAALELRRLGLRTAAFADPPRSPAERAR